MHTQVCIMHVVCVVSGCCCAWIAAVCIGHVCHNNYRCGRVRPTGSGVGASTGASVGLVTGGDVSTDEGVGNSTGGDVGVGAT